MPSGQTKWKHFERLVAAIHRAVDQGADVRWDETINGRQFDVTIRFRKGLYEYLTVIECKDQEGAVPVEKVEAFVTKSSDVNAHHAVMASTSGFQSGAQEVARRHNVTLIHVTDSTEVDLSMFGAEWAGTTEVLHIESIELEYADGEKRRLPEEANYLVYLAKHIRIERGAKQIVLEDVIRAHLSAVVGGAIDEYQDYFIELPNGARVIGPDDVDVPLKSLDRIRVRAGISRARVLKGPVMFEPYLLTPNVNVRNVATGELKTLNPSDLKLGFNNTFVAGCFYEQPRLATYYFCEKIEGDIAHMYLVESFQLGNLLQAKFTQKNKYANLYVPVLDKETVRRLQRRLDRLRAHENKFPK